MAVEKITHLTVKGFKSLHDVELELTPFTVLIGANGSGKSNFIDFFRMLGYAFGSSQGNLQTYVARKGNASSLLYYGPGQTRSIDASIQFDGENQWSRYAFSLTWGAPDTLFFASEELQYQRAHDSIPRRAQLGSGQPESRVHTVADQATDDWQRKVARVFRHRLRQIQAYHFHDTSDQANIRLTQDRTRADYLLHHGGNLAVFLSALQENNPGHYHRILDAVRLVAPFIKDFVLDPLVENPRSLLLRWMDRSGEVFGPHQLSDGTIRAIALVTALLQPEATMPSVILFDEPELGLHPAAVALVASLLQSASKQRQVIVATQSPILIRRFPPECVVVVERHEDGAGRGESRFTRLSTEALELWLEDYDLGELYEKSVTGGRPA